MIIYYPFDLIRTRMQTRQHHNYYDVWDGFRQILDNKGGKGKRKFSKLYTGAAPSFMLNISNQSLIFAITESMREKFKIRRNVEHVKDLTRYEYHTCSITAGALAGAVTNVLEVITINKQIMGKRFNLKKFIQEHGFYSFKSGILARIIINTLHTVTLFTVVDNIAEVFGVEL